MGPSAGASDLSLLLKRCASGDRAAEDELYQVAYRDLKMMARAFFRGEHHRGTLQPSMLVNEAYLRMPKAGEIDWQGRQHFFAIAARAMRRVLVDHARNRAADKRPDPGKRAAFDADIPMDSSDPTLVLAVDEALTRLAGIDPRAAQVVEMRFFADMTTEEIAAVLGVSGRTIKRDWEDGRLWLFSELKRRSGS
jgi:RNA polymerase sigma-70 factor (ECF subfamily)